MLLLVLYLSEGRAGHVSQAVLSDPKTLPSGPLYLSSRHFQNPKKNLYMPDFPIPNLRRGASHHSQC